MTNTPETDSAERMAFAYEYMIPTEVARKLERERDEAREELDEEKKFHHRTHAELIQTQCKLLDNQNDVMQLADRLTALELHSTSELARLERERDNAQERLRIVIELLSTHPKFENKHPEEVLEFVNKLTK
jgi:hypothetical protein